MTSCDQQPEGTKAESLPQDTPLPSRNDDYHHCMFPEIERCEGDAIAKVMIRLRSSSIQNLRPSFGLPKSIAFDPLQFSSQQHM